MYSNPFYVELSWPKGSKAAAFDLLIVHKICMLRHCITVLLISVHCQYCETLDTQLVKSHQSHVYRIVYPHMIEWRQGHLVSLLWMITLQSLLVIFKEYAHTHTKWLWHTLLEAWKQIEAIWRTERSSCAWRLYPTFMLYGPGRSAICW